MSVAGKRSREEFNSEMNYLRGDFKRQCLAFQVNIPKNKDDRIKELENDMASLKSEIASLQNEIKELKNNLINFEQRVGNEVRQGIFEELNKFLYPRLPPLDPAHDYFS